MFVKSIFVFLLALVLWHVYRLYSVLDYNVHHHKHRPKVCKKVPGVHLGSEDLDILSDGRVFVTSGLCSNSLPPGYLDFYLRSNKSGGIFLMDLSSDFEKIKAKELFINPSSSFDKSKFCPHGISVLENAQGRHLLYVVNHVIGDVDRIEKFRYNPHHDTLEHERSFTDLELVRSLNDVAAIEEDNFYATNCAYNSYTPYTLMEALLLLSWGDVIYFDGTHFRREVHGLRMPNGLSVGRRGQSAGFVYVNVETNVHVFQRHRDNSLVLLQDIELHTTPDNVVISPEGNVIYIANHPIGHLLFEHLQNPTIRAPSHVLELPLFEGQVKVKDISELLYDDGEFVSGSSVAVIYKDNLLVGTVISEMIVCKLNA